MHASRKRVRAGTVPGHALPARDGAHQYGTGGTATVRTRRDHERARCAPGSESEG